MLKHDDELEKFEEDLRKLKNKYDQFFAGIQKVPPSEDRRRLEVFIHEFSKQKMRDNGRRFRFNTLLSRFNQYREMWARRMREREEGPLDFRRRSAALAEPSAPAAAAPAVRPVTSDPSDPYVRVAPETNGDGLRILYDQIRDDYQKLGRAAPMTFEQLGEMIRQQSEVVRSRYNVNAVAFRVETVDGKVKLKAKPVQD